MWPGGDTISVRGIFVFLGQDVVIATALGPPMMWVAMVKVPWFHRYPTAGDLLRL